MKDIIAEHFDRSPAETERFTMYYQGEWWAPKHKDSLDFLVEAISFASKGIREKLESLSCRITKSASDIESVNKQMWDIIDAEL